MIQKIWFHPSLTEPKGLTSQKLHGLGKLVVLAGPNGSGKSRYLGLVQSAVQFALSARTERQDAENRLALHRARPKRIRGPEAEHAAEEKALEAEVEDKRETESATDLEELPGPSISQFVHLTYKLGQASADTQDIGRKQAQSIINANSTPGFAKAHVSIPAYFESIANALWDAGDQRLREDPAAIARASDAQDFNDLLNTLVGGRIEATQVRESVRFRGRQFAITELSEGEQVLVTWAIILHRQRDGLRDACILIDEPENHLHPDACVKAIAELRDSILGDKGQIWIATHSIQIIAFAGMDCLFGVDRGSIEYAGNKVDAVVQRLLGGPDGRNQLRTFLDDADALALHKFVAECLLPPMVVPTKEDDPQEALFAEAMRSRTGRDQPYRVLDYGAGRGRLASALRAAASRREPGRDEKPATVEYLAYNGPSSPTEEVEECKRRVAQLVDGVQGKHLQDLASQDGAIDLVVLCNVLHEIPVQDWVSTFHQIADLLCGDGSLLIMEDQTLRIGELPTSHGFIVLNCAEVALLFGTSSCELRELNANNDSQPVRLTLIEVPARLLRNVSVERIRDALCSVAQRAFGEIKAIRSEPSRSFQSGRRYAFFSMLHLNATLALEALSTSPTSPSAPDPLAPHS